jgi:alanine racemase
MKAAVLGRISMNQTMIKLSLKDNYKVGDEVVIVGKQGSEEITIEELAISMGTFWFEYIVTLHANRLPRFFVD